MNQNYRFMELSQFGCPLHWAAHGVVGGASAEAQGGKFGQGFISSAFTKAVSTQGLLPGEQGEFSVERLAAHAVVGGTASKLAGGKFANGAQTAAYGYLFNELGRNIRITRTETSVEYKKGGAIVVAENDVRGRKPPQLNVRQVTDLLKISKEENVKVQAVSSYRTDSKAHMYWNAVDVNIYSKDGKVYSSKQVADILFNSGSFTRVARYTDGRNSAHGDYKPYGDGNYGFI